jgi:hypothetical protein
VQHHVLGLDIAVHHTVRVRVTQGRSHVPRDAQGLVDRELPLARQPPAQGFALDYGIT